MKRFLIILLTLACAIPTFAETITSIFGLSTPAGWKMSEGWTPGEQGMVASGECSTAWEREAPGTFFVEAIFDIPSPDKLAAGTKLSLSLGADGRKVTATGEYLKGHCSATLSGMGSDGNPLSTIVEIDTVSSVLREQDQKKAADDPGWAGKTVTLGIAVSPDGCRMFINGVQAAESLLLLPAERKISLAANGITLRSVQLLPCPAPHYDFLAGYGVAALSGGAASRPAAGITPGLPQTVSLNINGVPMLAQRGADGLGVLDVSAEKYDYYWSASEGTGFLRAPVPAQPYKAAYLLVHRQPGKRAAMGFGLRAFDMSAADLKNIYLDGRPAFQPDQGVKVSPVPALGEGWYLVKVPLNPAAMQWYTHTTPEEWSTDKVTELKLQPFGARTGINAYFCRPWVYDAKPYPDGSPSGLSVAAVTFERAGIDLMVNGNGKGNVFALPEKPQLTATITNKTDEPITVTVGYELIPFAKKPASRKMKLKLAAGESRIIDVLAKPISEIGHYKVRVTADAGAAGNFDYRTNIGLIAADTRKKVDSPFGIWGALWTDYSKPDQRSYLKKLAGTSFVMGTDDHIIYMGPLETQVPDDAAAEEIIKKISKQAKVMLYGEECFWSLDQTLAFPQVISKGTTETLPRELNERIDRQAAEWRRLSKAARKLRPDLKISLGNSGINFTVPFLERGYKYGVEFDYFGTEEHLVQAKPEQPADSGGNINWWAKAVCEHFGFKNVPLFHSESIYFPTGPAFSYQTEKTQAANYARTFLLGFPYNSIYAWSGAIVDSSNAYIYSAWGMAGYCNQAPECSPKLSYVTYSALTQLLDGAKYDGRLDTGTASLYALRFRRADGSKLYALWNLRGERKIIASLAGEGSPQVINALNQPQKVKAKGNELPLTLSELPVYVTGATITSIKAGDNILQKAPQGVLIGKLENPSDWVIDNQDDVEFQKPRPWRGMPKARGNFTVTMEAVSRLAGKKSDKALTFTQQKLAGTHGLIPRYVSVTAKPGKEIPIPAGTTRLGVWVYGHSTWAQVKLGIKNAEGKTRLILADDPSARMADNFDGWRFLDTGLLNDDEFLSGSWSINRIVVTMTEQQVYVDDLITTEKPQVSVWGAFAMKDKVPAINYMPW